MSGTNSSAKVAERIAALVGASQATALHTARTLRTAKDAKGRRLNLWPQPGSGARDIAYTSTQMINLLLALAAGDPIRGPEIVASFRGLRRERWYAGQVTPLPGPTLGHDLDFITETLASGDDEGREYLRLAQVFLTFLPRPASRILIEMPGGIGHHIIYGVAQTRVPAELYRILEGSTDEMTGAMESLAIIWRETQAAMMPQEVAFLTQTEQRVMDRARRRSMRIVA
jgi:hypothetical protein